MKLFSFLVLVSFLVVSANALSIGAGADSIELSCSEGRVFVWATNTGQFDGTVSFSSSSLKLNAYFDEPFSGIKAGETKGTYFHAGAGNCFRGEDKVTVSAQFCAGGACETKLFYLSVNVMPCRTCGTYQDGSPVVYFYTQGADSRKVESTMQQFDSFYPIDYRVRITGREACISLYPDQFSRTTLFVSNMGAAGTFDVRILGDVGRLNGLVSHDYVSLQRGEGKDVFVDVKPAKSGRYSLTLQVLHNRAVLAEKDLCYDVKDTFGAKIILPEFIEARDCQQLRIFGTIKNTGTGFDQYSISGSDFAYFPQMIDVFPGDEKRFEIAINTSMLKLGPNALWIIGESDFVMGEGTATVFLRKCEETAVTAVSKQEGNKITVIISVSNQGPVALENVSASVYNIPEEWIVEKEGPAIVPANSVKNITLSIEPVGSREAKPIVKVSAGSQSLGIVELPSVSAKPQGITGMFIFAVSQNLLWIAALLFVVFLVLVLATRSKRDGRAEYLERIRKLRGQVGN